MGESASARDAGVRGPWRCEAVVEGNPGRLSEVVHSQSPAVRHCRPTACLPRALCHTSDREIQTELSDGPTRAAAAEHPVQRGSNHETCRAGEKAMFRAVPGPPAQPVSCPAAAAQTESAGASRPGGNSLRRLASDEPAPGAPRLRVVRERRRFEADRRATCSSNPLSQSGAKRWFLGGGAPRGVAPPPGKSECVSHAGGSGCGGRVEGSRGSPSAGGVIRS